MKLVALILFAVSQVSALHAGDKKVLLKDGSLHTVHVNLLGHPVHFKDKFVQISDIHPSISVQAGWREPTVSWQFKVDFRSGFKGILRISSVQSPGAAELELSERTFPGHARMEEFEIGIDTFDRGSAPHLWDWLNSGQDAWIPFHFQALDSSGKLVEEFDDWGFVSASDTLKANSALDSLSRQKTGIEQREVDLPGEIRLNAPVLNGKPTHFSDGAFQVNAIGPVVLPSKDHTKMISVWALKGQFIMAGEKKFTFSCPWFSKTFTQAAQTDARDFTILFGAESDAPEAWQWLSEVGESWVPWKIHVVAPNHPEGQDITEWALITPEVKAAIRSRINQK